MEVLSTILLPIVVLLVSVALTAVITMKIKFAESEKEAIQGLQEIGFRIFQFIWVAITVFLLVRETMSDDPVTRRSIVVIAVYVVSIAFITLINIIERILNLIRRMMDVQSRHISLTEQLVNGSDETSDTSNNANAPDAKQSRG